jgi:spermidine synthase
LFLPLFGTQSSLLIFAGGNFLLGLISWLYSRREMQLPLRKSWIGTGALGILFIFLASTLHAHLNVVRTAGVFRTDTDNQLIHLEEDTSATVSVEKRSYLGLPYHSLSVNGVNVAGTSPNLVTIQKMQAHVPVILFGPNKKKEILHVGFGSGGTAYSASLYPNTSITVVEISRAIVRNANMFFQSVNHSVAHSDKVKFIYFDGRSYLQNTTKTYDIILSDSIHPRYSGNGSLYTEDYYRLVYHHLNAEGVHSQWIPIYSVAQQNLKEILKAFSDIFQDTSVWYINSTINPFIIVTGRKESKGLSLEKFREAFKIPAVAQDLKGISMLNELYLLDHFLFGNSGLQRYVGDAEPHIDDRLSVEYESSRIINRQLSWWLNFRDLLQFREPVYPYLTSVDSLDRVNYDRFYQATKVNLTGQLLFVAGRRSEAKKAFAKAQEENGIDREPFEYYHTTF